MNSISIFILGMSLSLVLIGLLENIKPMPCTREKEIAVKEYLEHPENFKVQYLTVGKDTVEIRIHYVK